MSEVDKVNKKTIKQGGVLALLYFDIHGSNKDSIKQLAVGFVQRLIKETGVVYARGEIDKPIFENDVYSTSVEVTVLTKSFENLVRLCANYSPFSVEVLEPNSIKLPISQMHDVLMGISAATYDYKKYIIEKTSNSKDLRRYKLNLENKMKVGKKLLNKKNKDSENEKDKKNKEKEEV